MISCQHINHKGQPCKNAPFDITGFCRHHHPDISLRPSTGKYFEEEVEKALKVLGYKVDRNVHINGCQIDIYGVKWNGVIPDRLMVECKDNKEGNTVGIEEVTAFCTKFHQARNGGIIDKGLFVTTYGYTAPAKTWANAAGVTLVTYAELSTQPVNFDLYIDQLIENYEGTPFSKYYIDLSGTEEEEYEGNEDAVFYRPIEGFIQRSLFKDHKGKLALLGNFGTGKSTFCLKYAYDLAQQYKKDKTARIPVVISLKDYDSKFHIQDLILNTLQHRYGVDINVPKYQALQRMGRFIFLFDGFDEMDARANPDTIRENLRELNKISEIKENKFILTCRTHFFRSKVHAEVLGDIELLYIPEWSEMELAEYLQKRFGKDWEKYLKRIVGTHNLPELSKTPLFLDMIAETLSSLGDNVKRIELYRVYTDKWIKDQSKRRGALLTANERRVFVKELAVKLFVENSSECNYKNFTGFVKQCLVRLQTEGDKRFETDDAMQLDYLGSDIQTCTFLVRDKDGNYSFGHKSFMEFFVAQELAEEIKRGSFKYLDGSVLQVDIRDFLIEFLSEDNDDTPDDPTKNTPVNPPVSPLADPLLKGLETAESEILKDNLLSIISRLNIPIPSLTETKEQKLEKEFESNIIARFIKGDRKAMEELYKRYHPQVVRMLIKNGADEKTACDIFNDAFLGLLEKKDAIESIQHFRNFLFIFAKNKMINYWRKENMHKKMLTEYSLDDDDDVDRTFLTGMIGGEVLSKIYEAIEVLSEREQQIIKGYYFNQKNTAQIAKELGQSANAVNKARFKIMKKLRGYLKTYKFNS